MRPIVTDRGAWLVCLSVGRSVTILSHAKTVELIKTPFWAWTRVVPRNHVLDKVQILTAKGQFWGRKRYLHVKWRAERARSTILLQRNPSFGEMPD